MRELANALERAAILADGDAIDATHLWIDEPRGAAAAAAERARSSRSPSSSARRSCARSTRSAATAGSAAELLGIGERTLYDKLKKYGVDG